MAETILKKVRSHQKYHTQDGSMVPGVTTILNVLAKPALVGWANRMGLQGIDTTKYVDSKAEIGTIAHYLIECDLRGEKPDLSEYAPIQVSTAENSFLKWLDWKSAHVLELLKGEEQLVSEQFRYGGTIDIYCKLDGVLTLIDIKTSGSGIWPEMRHQVAAYWQLLIENELPVSQVIIVRVGRDDKEGFQTETVGELEEHLQLFLHTLEVYRLQKKLAK